MHLGLRVSGLPVIALDYEGHDSDPTDCKVRERLTKWRVPSPAPTETSRNSRR